MNSAMDRDEALFRMFGKFYPQGAILFSESDPGDEMYYVQSGTVSLSSGKERGGNARTIGPGQITGAGVLFGREPRKVSAEVKEDSRLLVFNAHNLAQAVRNGPEMTAEIIAGLMQSLDRAWDELRRWQLFFYLDKVAVHLKSSWPPEGRSVTEVSMSTDIEEGIVRRIFEEFVKAGVLTCQGDAFRLSSADALARLADLQSKIDAGSREKV